MAWGFFKKLCVADVLAVYVDAAYSSLRTQTGFALLFAIFGFTIQIYCDFSGYSDIAIGTAKLFGIELMTNFDSPYFSCSIKEFWSRWHISLSTWFRDYVYIPLGGNRCGKLRHSANLLITFLVSGLWHGASWTFVIWGGIHGIAQIIENIFANPLRQFRKTKIGHLLLLGATFVFCSVAWTFFRADTFSDAIYVIAHALDGVTSGRHYFSNAVGLEYSSCMKIFFLVSILSLYDFASLKTDVIVWLTSRHIFLRWTVYAVFIFIIFLFANIGNNSFIYFQF